MQGVERTALPCARSPRLPRRCCPSQLVNMAKQMPQRRRFLAEMHLDENVVVERAGRQRQVVLERDRGARVLRHDGRHAAQRRRAAARHSPLSQPEPPPSLPARPSGRRARMPPQHRPASHPPAAENAPGALPPSPAAHLSTTPCSCVRLTSRRTVAGCPVGACSWNTTRRTHSSSASCGGGRGSSTG